MTHISHDSATPQPGQQVITATVFIHHNFNGEEKLFLPKRAETKKFLPGVYELPGGHIDFGEDIKNGLKREIQEEFHMNISLGDPFYAFTYMNNIKGAHAIEVVYFATFTDSITQIVLNPEDHTEFIWLSENNIDQVLSSVKNEEDVEIQAIIKGFKLLKGEMLNFG